LRQKYIFLEIDTKVLFLIAFAFLIKKFKKNTEIGLSIVTGSALNKSFREEDFFN